MNSFRESLRKNYKGILLILVSSLFTALGQLLWKLSLGNINIYLITGFICYGIGALVMIIAFKYGSLSVIHPFMCSSYVIAFVLGYCVLGESIGYLKIIGGIIIVVGVMLIGGGDN